MQIQWEYHWMNTQHDIGCKSKLWMYTFIMDTYKNEVSIGASQRIRLFIVENPTQMDDLG